MGLKGGAVEEIRAVADEIVALDHMIPKNFCELFDGHMGEGGANVLEGVVVGREYSQVGSNIHIIVEGRVGDGSTNGG